MIECNAQERFVVFFEAKLELRRSRESAAPQQSWIEQQQQWAARTQSQAGPCARGLDFSRHTPRAGLDTEHAVRDHEKSSRQKREVLGILLAPIARMPAARRMSVDQVLLTIVVTILTTIVIILVAGGVSLFIKTRKIKAQCIALTDQ